MATRRAASFATSYTLESLHISGTDWLWSRHSEFGRRTRGEGQRPPIPRLKGDGMSRTKEERKMQASRPSPTRVAADVRGLGVASSTKGQLPDVGCYRIEVDRWLVQLLARTFVARPATWRSPTRPQTATSRSTRCSGPGTAVTSPTPAMKPQSAYFTRALQPAS
jgi:hypothetical protein